MMLFPVLPFSPKPKRLLFFSLINICRHFLLVRIWLECQSSSASVDLDLDAAAAQQLGVLDAALGQVDAQQAALEAGLELAHLDVVGQGEGAAPGAQVALGQQYRRHRVGAQLGLDGFAGRGSFQRTSIFFFLICIRKRVSNSGNVLGTFSVSVALAPSQTLVPVASSSNPIFFGLVASPCTSSVRGVIHWIRRLSLSVTPGTSISMW